MKPPKAVRRWVWRRLEPRVQAVVDQRLDHHLGSASVRAAAGDLRRWQALESSGRALLDRSVESERRLDELGRQLRSSTATSGEARRLATEAARAIERILQAELELWQALDAMRSEGECASPGTATASPGRSG